MLVRRDAARGQRGAAASRARRGAAWTTSGCGAWSTRRSPPSSRRLRPDAVLIAARGPLARVLARLVAELSPRPVIVTGLPGISIPATSRALQFRAQCDLFVLHSTREMREFAALAADRAGWRSASPSSRLPFAAVAGRAPARRRRDRPRVRGAGDRAAERAERMRVARAAHRGRGGGSFAARRRQAPGGGGREADPPRGRRLPRPARAPRATAPLPAEPRGRRPGRWRGRSTPPRGSSR